jgi:homoserine acetyltransferase
MAVAADKIAFWGYNSSLGGKWAPLRIPIRDNANVKLEFPAVTIPDQIAHDGLYRFTVPVEGIERIAVVLGASPFTGGNATRGAGSLDIYLGVNTI